MQPTSKPCVLLTGFGPFRQHLVNPSWEAVKGVKASGLLADVQIHIMEVPVSYRKAQEVILGMWRSLNPKLAVHFGVAPRSDTIILEQTGKNTKYTNRDIEGLCPSKGCCVEGGPQQIDSIIDMKAARRRLQLLGLDVLYSRDAGRFLCDFLYYSSLYYGSQKAVFIHVPGSGSLSKMEMLVPALTQIIETLIELLDETVPPTADPQ
ncbi:pyroglutamyl-peptidase 1-like isoform X3 [Polypterus senegalus]|uniref:pyroglutamyl-peptidase 1-like isoform X3 n=1 Tax=Polypterus senegalus TaxID=55291 RepID=UPI001963242B|nr:pyroglutamyl-peptidase 1-like isoform X3 [Polypterus senegalus]